ncbi:glucose 1-dehydrogenase [uncultured Reyranella sp.]|uniref:glucose 1-dehydrogenase n=1 Tax=uncultured Reyranella sp. TaxID=735512 RepID=UPI0025E6692B|nr:glucose 1-dehydrogenase [uncultured Reyranella sp.]
MKVITVEPGVAGSVRLEDRREPEVRPDQLLVQAMALGICGTDREIMAGSYGWAPDRNDRLVLGHESLGRVLKAPDSSNFAVGDHVVGIVRRPDPVPCRACGAGEWDMCLNGRYVERGIKSLDGYGAERFLLEPDYAVRVAPHLGMLGVLLEPASVLAKAWDHIYRIGQRTRSWQPKSALVTGAGPVGLLAALMATQRGLELHVLDRAEGGPKADLTRALGGTYHPRELPKDFAADIVVECTGAPQLVIDVLCGAGGRNGIVCLTGVSSGGRLLPFDSGNFNRSMVLQNDLVFGSVNANRSHYESGARALATADPAWLAGLLTRRVPLTDWREAFERRDGDIKVVVEFEPPGS